MKPRIAGKRQLAIVCPSLFAACILIVYLAFLTRTYYWDGVLFSLDIENVHARRAVLASLFHPNHLIYNLFGYGIYSAAVAFWPGIRALTVLQVANVLLSVLAGYVLFLLARIATHSNAGAFFCWLLFAAGATWWKFSTDADTYILCVLLLLLNAWLLLRARPRLWAAAMCHVTAMLFHELAVFSYVPVVALLMLDKRKSFGARLSTVIGYCVLTGGMVALAYWLCYINFDHSVHGLLKWITSYASDTSFTHSVTDIGRYYTLSYLKLFAGGKLSLVRQFFSVVECAGFVLCVALLIWAVRRLRTARSGTERHELDPRVLSFLWAWLVGYAIFFAAWDPGSAFHKLFVWPAVVLLIGAYFGRNKSSRLPALTAFAGALAAWNFAAFIYPHSRAGADPVLVLAHKIDRELPNNAVVFYRVLDPDDWYLQYFAPGRQWLSMPDGMDTTSMLMSTSGPVCLETTALQVFHGDIDPRLKWDLVNRAHNVRLECLKRSQ